MRRVTRTARVKWACFAVAATAAVAAPIALAAVTPENGEFKGFATETLNGKRSKVILHVSNHGTKMRIRTEWYVTCPDAPPGYTEKPLVVELQSVGRITNGKLPTEAAPFSQAIEVPGQAGKFLESIYFVPQGRFATPRLVRGTYEAKAEITDPQGQHWASCSLPHPVKWWAKLAG